MIGARRGSTTFLACFTSDSGVRLMAGSSSTPLHVLDGLCCTVCLSWLGLLVCYVKHNQQCGALQGRKHLAGSQVTLGWLQPAFRPFPHNKPLNAVVALWHGRHGKQRQQESCLHAASSAYAENLMNISLVPVEKSYTLVPSIHNGCEAGLFPRHRTRVQNWSEDQIKYSLESPSHADQVQHHLFKSGTVCIQTVRKRVLLCAVKKFPVYWYGTEKVGYKAALS
jgi:hypothetical protein